MEYQVMPDIREKEKIVGGLFTITQTIPLALALICGGGLAVVTFSATQSIVMTVVVFIVGAAPFLPFAFIKIEKMGNMELFFYLMIKMKYKKSHKVYCNLNENQRKRLMGEISK